MSFNTNLWVILTGSWGRSCPRSEKSFVSGARWLRSRSGTWHQRSGPALELILPASVIPFLLNLVVLGSPVVQHNSKNFFCQNSMLGCKGTKITESYSVSEQVHTRSDFWVFCAYKIRGGQKKLLTIVRLLVGEGITEYHFGMWVGACHTRWLWHL